ncbi:CDP-archaeol synthase [Neoehrlichia mikurensis]|uniref:Phosphatidate cytidylyltransferase n=1 Tax=Neoehrlichia mikurensis TaxID=89586 RepID=A0A9Q9C0M2_9RICK|nr:CDP-archaeol synthase [Neoehrlichia mikurensis]QXK91696.1 CDP-archaeol synthase [Neoehrlichia mikurensis]QXK92907.1 CDP-archaeol synthase [Neoehrlichia mikurensis]QXK93387.1 CDP-archaeol synthase [Neoehrlichia mikurensis]UTO55665.1 phosphatidate cytidylyltransferase [Neoehrlichia mikurensis]UTO56585.1 phosphatidate cytidylyltransferase [Neoehrlichia mikurensis]
MVGKNLLIRMLSSVLIFCVLIFSLYSGRMVVYTLFFSIAVISAFEWGNMTAGKKVFYIPAFFIIILPYASLLYIYSLPHGTMLLLWLIFSVWSTDIAAYFIGKSIGGWKILPGISPNKTWSGLCGGIVFSMITSVMMSIIFGIFSISHSFIIGIIIAIIAQIGDFTESFIKRLCNVKNSGSVIPGHGGMLDRMDGFIFTAPLTAYYIKGIAKFF